MALEYGRSGAASFVFQAKTHRRRDTVAQLGYLQGDRVLAYNLQPNKKQRCTIIIILLLFYYYSNRGVKNVDHIPAILIYYPTNLSSIEGSTVIRDTEQSQTLLKCFCNFSITY